MKNSPDSERIIMERRSRTAAPAIAAPIGTAQPSNPRRAVQCFACEQLKVAVFKNRLILSIRTEQIRENLANSFASARNRACKHASTNLHGVNATNLFSVVSTPPSPLKTQLETRFDDVQATIVSLVEALAPPRHHKQTWSL